MTLPLSVHGATDRGLVHETNEDSWIVFDTDEGGRVLVVCDGMGGMGRGDEASQLAVRVLEEEVRRGGSLLPPERLRAAIRVADETVRRDLCDDGLGLPGSTAVLVYVIDGAAHVAWVGDSRAYLVRGGTLIERTRDHKLVEELVDAGQISIEDAKHSTLAHVVTRALGGRSPEDPVVKAATLDHPWKLLHGDRIVLCSDGVCDLIDDDEVATMVHGVDPEAGTQVLVQKALERGGHDNITTIIGLWDGPSWVEDDQSTPVILPARRDVPDLRVHRNEAYGDLETAGRITEEIDLDALERQAGLGEALGADPTAPIEDEDGDEAAQGDDEPAQDDDDESTELEVEALTSEEENTDTLLATAAAGQSALPTSPGSFRGPVSEAHPLDRTWTHVGLLAALLVALTLAWWLVA